MTGLLRLLHLRHIRRRPMRAVLTALSLAAGVALAMSVLIVRTSFDRSVTSFGRTLAGPAPLRVIGPASRGGLDGRVLDTVRAVDGVGTAIPLVQAVTIADGIRGHSELVAAIGVECGGATPFGSFPCPRAGDPDATPPPLVSSWLATRRGPTASLRTDVTEVRLADAPHTTLLDRVNRGRAVVYPLPVAQRLFAREGALDVIYVTPTRGTSVDALRTRLAAAVGPHNGVLAATDPPPGITTLLAFTLGLLGMLSLFALGIGGMLARNTVMLSLVERRRDVAVAAAVGATPRMLTTAILCEVAVMGAIGGLLGALGGVLLARPMLQGMDRFTSRLIGAHLTVHVSPAVVVASIVVAVAAAVLATWRPARQAARLDVAAELLGRDTAAETAPALNVRRGAVLVGVGLFGVVLCRVGGDNGGLDPWQPIAAQIGMLVASIGLIGAVGWFAPVAAGVIGRALGAAPGPLRLGVANLARSRRTGVMAVAVAAAVGVAFSIASFTRSVHDAVSANIEGDAPRISINTVPVSNSINIDGKPWPSTLDRLAHIAGVEAVERNVALLARQPDGSTIGAVASEGERALHLDGRLLRGTADLDKFARGEVVIGPALARRHHVHAGDRLAIAGRNGVVDVTVQGVEQFGDFGGTQVRMPMSLLTQLYGPQPPSWVAVKVAPGADIDAVTKAIERAHLQPRLDAETPHQVAATIAGEVTRQIEPFWALQRAMVIVSFVAVLFTLLLSAIQRRRELGVLGAIGMRPGEVAAMLLAEGATVGVTGAILGSIASFGFIVGMGYTTAVVIGFDDPTHYDVVAPFFWGALCVVVVLVAASWPAWRAARTEVLPALQYE